MTKEEGFITAEDTNARLFEMILKAEAHSAHDAGIPMEDMTMVMTGVAHGVEKILELFTDMVNKSKSKDELYYFLTTIAKGIRDYKEIAVKEGYAREANPIKKKMKEELYTAAESKMVH